MSVPDVERNGGASHGVEFSCSRRWIWQFRCMNRLLISALLCTPFLTLADVPYWQQVGTFNRPLDLVALPAEAGQVSQFIVVEQPGKLQLTDLQGNTREILDWTERVLDKANEQGFFKLVLAPDFPQSGRAYFNLTNSDDDVEIIRYYFDPSDLSKSTQEAEVLLTIEQPHKNHNGGWMDFGPDGMLYIATGDGGGAHDEGHYAQNMQSHLGKILRLDVSSSSGYEVPSDNPYVSDGTALDEIYAYGLRNPWRCHWHGKTLLIADVGQNAWEEINAVDLDKLKGADFGWRMREGYEAAKKHGAEKPKNAIDPILAYGRKVEEGDDLAGNSITGGVYYEGQISSLSGRYFFGDHAQPRVWSIKLGDDLNVVDRLSHAKTIKPDEGEIQLISSFALDNEGEMYLLARKGGIFKLRE